MPWLSIENGQAERRPREQELPTILSFRQALRMLFDERERFVVAAPLKIVLQLRRGGRREFGGSGFDCFGGGLQLVEMSRRVAGVQIAIGNRGQPFAKRQCEAFVS